MANKQQADTLRISAKCSDLFRAKLYTKDGHQIGPEYMGYPPTFISEGSGDYVRFSVELATGKIKGWIAPTQDDLDTYFPQEEEKNESVEDDND